MGYPQEDIDGTRHVRWRGLPTRKSGVEGRRQHLLTRACATSFEPIGDLPEILPLARGVPTTPEVVTPDLAEELKSFATLKHRAQQLLAETGR